MTSKGNLLIACITACILLCGCNDDSSQPKPDSSNTETDSSIQITSEGSEQTMGNLELDGFALITRGKITDTDHSLEDITKIMFYESYDMQMHNPIAINIADKWLFIEPFIGSSLDFEEPDYRMAEEDVETVLGILARSEVLSWDSWYGEVVGNDPDRADGGGTWVLYIQYNDNTISRFGGTIHAHPSGYDSFVEEMIAFTHSKKDA